MDFDRSSRWQIDWGRVLLERDAEAIEALGRWQRESRLVQKEDTMVGLENAPRALMRLFAGENFEKQLLKIADAGI
jgi:NADPH-dependent curcumin reductase CurA